MLFKKIYQLGDKFEDKLRGKLSHYPIFYAFVGGAGIIIFWRGIWRLVDYFFDFILTNEQQTDLFWLDGTLSVIFGTTLLLAVGLFVSSFIGNEIIISGIKGEKRIAEKTELEIEQDISLDIKTEIELKDIAKRLERIEKLLEKK